MRRSREMFPMNQESPPARVPLGRAYLVTKGQTCYNTSITPSRQPMSDKARGKGPLRGGWLTCNQS